jgi:hypothetical protein
LSSLLSSLSTDLHRSPSPHVGPHRSLPFPIDPRRPASIPTDPLRSPSIPTQLISRSDETPPSTKSRASNTCQSCELLALLAGNLKLKLTIQSYKTSRFCLLPRHVIRRLSWIIFPLLTEGIVVLPRHAIRRRSWHIVPLLTEGTGVLPRHAARRQSWLVPLTLGQVPLLTEGTGVMPRQANCAVLQFGAVFAALDLNHSNKTLTFGCLQPRSSVEVPG